MTGLGQHATFAEGASHVRIWGLSGSNRAETRLVFMPVTQATLAPSFMAPCASETWTFRSNTTTGRSEAGNLVSRRCRPVSGISVRAGAKKPSSSPITLMQTSNQRSSRTSLHIYRRTARDLQIEEFCNRIGRPPDIRVRFVLSSHVEFPTATLPAPAAGCHVDLCCIAVYMETRGDWFAIPVTSPSAHAPVAASREARSCPPKTGRCLRICRCIGPT